MNENQAINERFAGFNQLYDLPDDLKEVVSDHWAKFPPQHPLITHIFGILFFVLWVVNFFGNGLVIYIFLKTKVIIHIHTILIFL